jgi:putative peptide zinc metalloprotease protein
MMKLEDCLSQTNYTDWICPDIRPFWRLAYLGDSDQVILKATQEHRQYQFSLAEGYALQHFIGQFTVTQIQKSCQQQFKHTLSANFVEKLLEKLLVVGILALPGDEPHPSTGAASNFIQLKAAVQWIHHPEGYWILRNPEDVTFLQVGDRDKLIIQQLSEKSPEAIAQQHHLTREELRYLLQLLTATAMIVGTKKPKRPKGKFNPLQLLSFKFSLFNPDPWLTRHVDKLRWIWTMPVCLTLCFFLAWSAALGISESHQILFIGQHLWATQKDSLTIAFVLLMTLVVSIHELAHAFTLKHYGGIVPEIGLMFMCLMPGCYTNTSDAYCLVKRRQRTLVVAAGVLCQLIIWAIALWLWNASSDSSWLHSASYLLMMAALFTVAVNLNPMSKFDGYYLAVALTGINNLRSRSFGLYANFLTRKPIQETQRDRTILAIYAPFSLAYTFLIFGHLLLWLLEWSIGNIPTLALSLLVLWVIYFNFPNGANPSPKNS